MLLALLPLLPTATHAAACKSYIKHVRNQLNQNDEMKQLGWLSITQLQQALGPGKKTSLQNGKVQYDWTCPKDNSITLTVTMVNDNKIETLQGSYSDEQGAEQFSNYIYKNPITTEEPLEKRISTLNTNYNQYFNSDVTSIDEIKKEALNRVKTFYAAVRYCKPGTYQYMVQDIAGIVFYTSVIKGKQNDSCLVESTLLVPGKASGKKICRYKPLSQLLFTESQADFDGAGNFSYDAANITPFQQVTIDDCTYEVQEIKK